MEEKIYYTVWGTIRGGCGHAHRTLQGAVRCLERDQNGCQSRGGYSDREIRVISDRKDAVSYDTVFGPGGSAHYLEDDE